MAKVKNWLFSMDAKGHLGHQLTGQGSLGGQRVQPYRKPGGKASEQQEKRRLIWKKIYTYWRINVPEYPFNWNVWMESLRTLGLKQTALSCFTSQFLKFGLGWREMGSGSWSTEVLRVEFVYPDKTVIVKPISQSINAFSPINSWIDWSLSSVEDGELDLVLQGYSFDYDDQTYSDVIVRVPDAKKWKYAKVYARMYDRAYGKVFAPETLILPICYNDYGFSKRKSSPSSNRRKPQPQHTTKEGK